MLLLARHGATELNLRRPYVLQGQAVDLPLCDLGRRQANALAQALAKVRIGAVVSSPLIRARQTAAAVADLHGLSVRVLPGITEANVGRWESLSWEQARREWPEEVASFE